MNIAMSKFVNYILFFVLSLSIVACDNGRAQEERLFEADSLCNAISDNRYKNPQTVYWLANELLGMSETGSEWSAIAQNALAYVAFMRMDYGEAIRLYNDVIEMSRCEVERLVADVGMMTLCYRTSANRDFFDYRASAMQRMKRIEEEFDLLSDGEKSRFLCAKVEFDIASICYFSNIGIENEMLSSVEQLQVDLLNIKDVSLRIYARMVLYMQPGNMSMDERFRMLCTGLDRAESGGFVWLEANYRLLLAIMLRDDIARKTLSEFMTHEFSKLNSGSHPMDELPLLLAMEAVKEFNSYGDRYMAIEALAVAASCNTQIARFGDAILLLDDALDCVNNYYANFYGLTDSADCLSLDSFDESVEIARMECDSIINIAECLLSVRREASCAYAGIGDKSTSDINRNSYLDLLKTTRLNKQMESSADAAASDARRMYIWSIIAIVTLLAVIMAAYILNRKWRRHNIAYTTDYKRVLKLCRRLMTALPKELDGREAVYSAVEDILNKGLEKFSGVTRFSFVAPTACSPMPFVYDFPLIHIDGGVGEKLFLSCSDALSKEKSAFVELLLPYIAVAIDEGLRIADIGDEQLQAEQQRLSYNIYLTEHKRENVHKRVSMSLVNGMRPYMDRMLNEMSHLSRTESMGDVERLRLEYVAELTEKLDDYNLILERWIKMRRGELCLHIENFALAELFDIIAKSRQAFELKGVALDVKDTYAVVKADKALTFFMINTMVDNAGKFTPSGGSVMLEAVEATDYVEIAVSDTGEGMSQQDIHRIMNEKVYDASSIGRGTALAKNKGVGFGLMNCKGIIEKYRKTDALFDVCRMDIESTPGVGSRFSFRLPKGVLRLLSVIFLLLPSLTVSADNNFFEQVNSLADSVYQCNVEGRYNDALLHAQNALSRLNDFYRAQTGGVDTLSFSAGTSAEIRWWRDAVFEDSLSEDVFFNLLDIRNEVAVASLALQDWGCYRYNNNIYALLYRLVHEDKEVALYYERMRRVANYRQVAVVLCVTLLSLLLIAYALLYVRHGLIERMNSQLVLDINRRLLKLAGGSRVDMSELARQIADEIFNGMREMLRAKRVVLLLNRDEGECVIVSANGVVDETDEIYLRRSFENGKSFFVQGGLSLLLPMAVISSGERSVIGAILIETERNLTENEIMTVELVADYAASAAYHSAVHLASKYKNLEDIQEETERVRYEKNRLHVQNQVMDNCLSMIKHETIYYPGRIRGLVQQLRSGVSDDAFLHERIAMMKELMDYYNSVFGVLSACAMRQLDDAVFRVSAVPLCDVWTHLHGFVSRRAAKRSKSVELICEPTSAVASGDFELIYFLFELLIDAALVTDKLHLMLRAAEEDDSVRVELVHKGVRLSSDEIAELFVPSKEKIVGETVVGMEYLAAKEIVRMHEECMGRHAERMEARNSAEGLVIYFTLPR